KNVVLYTYINIINTADTFLIFDNTTTFNESYDMFINVGEILNVTHLMICQFPADSSRHTYLNLTIGSIYNSNTFPGSYIILSGVIYTDININSFICDVINT